MWISTSYVYMVIQRILRIMKGYVKFASVLKHIYLKYNTKYHFYGALKLTWYYSLPTSNIQNLYV